jgi:hypothetical protein
MPERLVVGVAAMTDIAPTKIVIKRLKTMTIAPILTIRLRFIGLDYSRL